MPHKGIRSLTYLFAIKLIRIVKELYLSLRKAHQLSFEALTEELVFLDYLIAYGDRSGRHKTAHFRRSKFRCLGKDLQDIFTELFSQCFGCGLAKAADVICKERRNKERVSGILIDLDLL